MRPGRTTSHLQATVALPLLATLLVGCYRDAPPAHAQAPLVARPAPPPAAPPPPPAADPPPPAEEVAHLGYEDHDDADDDSDDDGDGTDAGALNFGLSPAKPKKAALSDDDIRKLARSNPSALGSISVGKPNRGRLVNGVQMPQNERWVLVDPSHAYGTQETIDALSKAINKVADAHPGAPKMYIGHISAKDGGWLRPHKSHQAGRDVDVSYYLKSGHRWYETGTDGNLDKERTWAFVKALAQSGDAEMVLIDSSIQKILRAYASGKGEDATFLDKVFQFGSKQPTTLVRHWKGHASHIHIRFQSPEARRVGEIAAAQFPLPDPPVMLAKHAGKGGKGGGKHANAKDEKKEQVVFHTVRSGELLMRIAKNYGVSVEAIRKANGMKDDRIKPKQVLRIPKG